MNKTHKIKITHIMIKINYKAKIMMNIIIIKINNNNNNLLHNKVIRAQIAVL